MLQRKQVATVEEVGTRLEEWRQSRRYKRAAIPDELWSAAEGAIVRTTFRPQLALLAVFDERQALRLDPLKRKGALG